ncbi:50S ribosomal protein L5 [Citrus sinensis]|uniref:50S ribosomal protein L5 n=1 Tax=Citrus sinensis TaxID=2711 RepID=A0ACB8MPY4_CITSI|nr:50S ribosomal protein L5 [Citrus sinensis]
MACPSLLHSSASSFHGRFPALSSSSYVRPTYPNPINVNGVVSVKAAAGGIVLVEKSEAEKTGRLKTTYLEKIVPLLREEFSYTNIHQVPKIEKIVVNCGIGDAAQNAKGLEAAMNDLALITGQRPVKTRARNSIATFKIREGEPLGIAVTLRGNCLYWLLSMLYCNVSGATLTLTTPLHCTSVAGCRLAEMMYSFLDRLINLGLPRTRDFQGVNPNSFDGHGNYSIGVKEQSVFPEIRYDALGKPKGMDVCITTTAKTDKEGQRLLALMGMPFREGGGPANLIRKKKLKAHHFDSKSKGKSRR